MGIIQKKYEWNENFDGKTLQFSCIFATMEEEINRRLPIMNYIGLKCPVCGKAFTAEDDIVVCPECGAPYHRSCYVREGKCIYTDRHGNFTWKAPQPKPSDEESKDIKRCPRCGAPNSKDALFCAHCGLPFSENAQQQNTSFPGQGSEPGQAAWRRPSGPNIPPQGGNMPPNYGYPGQQGPFHFPMDPLGGVDPNEPIGGIPAGDVAKYVQENTQYYIPAFANQSHFRRNRFNFSAFFFQGIWMLFRKLYKVGAFITALQGAMLFAYLFLMKYFIMPLYENLYSLAGITQNNYSSSITAEQKSALLKAIQALPAWQQWVAALPPLFFIANIVLMIVCGLIGNKIYFKHCLSEVQRIHSEKSSPAEFAVHLQREGGINTSLAVGLIFCLIMIYFFALSF